MDVLFGKDKRGATHVTAVTRGCRYSLHATAEEGALSSPHPNLSPNIILEPCHQGRGEGFRVGLLAWPNLRFEDL